MDFNGKIAESLEYGGILIVVLGSLVALTVIDWLKSIAGGPLNKTDSLCIPPIGNSCCF